MIKSLQKKEYIEVSTHKEQSQTECCTISPCIRSMANLKSNKDSLGLELIIINFSGQASVASLEVLLHIHKPSLLNEY